MMQHFARGGLWLAACLALAAPAAPAKASATCPRALPRQAETRPVGPDLARSPVFSEAVIGELNYHRCRAGLRPVAADRGAGRISAGHSAWMARAGRMSHESNVPGRKSLADRLDAEGIRISYRAYENIAHLRHYSVAGLACRAGRRIPSEAELAREVVRQWLGSPPHRRQMMSPGVTRAGGAAAASMGEATCGTLFLTLNLYG